MRRDIPDARGACGTRERRAHVKARNQNARDERM
jgi:hypothetical protein